MRLLCCLGCCPRNKQGSYEGSDRKKTFHPVLRENPDKFDFSNGIAFGDAWPKCPGIRSLRPIREGTSHLHGLSDGSVGKTIPVYTKAGERNTVHSLERLRRTVQIQCEYSSMGLAVEGVKSACVSMKPADSEGISEGCMYVRYPLASGDLFEVCVSEKGISHLESMVEPARDLARALQVMHEDDVVHRDIKAENVLVYHTEDGTLCWKWADFDFSRDIRPDERPSSPVGTREYLPPERSGDKIGNPYDAKKNDVWAFGVLLYTVASKLAFNPAGELLCDDNYVHRMLAVFLNKYRGSAYREQSYILVDLLLRMLERDPEKRCSMDEVCAHPFFTRVSLDRESYHPTLQAWLEDGSRK